MPDAAARITSEPLDPARLMALVSGPSMGAVVVFTGTVRDIADGRPVTGLRYDAYVRMAEDELARIVQDGEARIEGVRIAVAHRIGTLDVGETSVIIAAAHAHRAPAFEACRYVIEELKRRVPIWKHEQYADGGAAWVGAASQTGA